MILGFIVTLLELPQMASFLGAQLEFICQLAGSFIVGMTPESDCLKVTTSSGGGIELMTAALVLILLVQWWVFRLTSMLTINLESQGRGRSSRGSSVNRDFGLIDYASRGSISKEFGGEVDILEDIADMMDDMDDEESDGSSVSRDDDESDDDEEEEPAAKDEALVTNAAETKETTDEN